MLNEISKEFVKCIFTEKEKRDIAIKMAQQVANLQQAEDDKKAVMSDYKSRIDGIQAGVNSAATKLNNGYEMRQIDCEIVPDWKRKMWEYKRVDTGDIIKEKLMTSEDLQMKL